MHTVYDSTSGSLPGAVPSCVARGRSQTSSLPAATHYSSPHRRLPTTHYSPHPARPPTHHFFLVSCIAHSVRASQVSEQLQLYLIKLPFISAALRLAGEDELTLLALHSELPQAAPRAAYLTTLLTHDGVRALLAKYPARPKYKDYDRPLEYAHVLNTAAAWQKKMSSVPYTRPEEKAGVDALKMIHGWLSSGLKLDADGGRGFWFQYELVGRPISLLSDPIRSDPIRYGLVRPGPVRPHPTLPCPAPPSSPPLPCSSPAASPSRFYPTTVASSLAVSSPE